jgi:arsenate reductase
MSRPSVLFVCVHNAGRSQMAAAWLRHLAGDRVDVRSAGSAPADQINPMAVRAMREVGIDLTGQTPKILDQESARSSDVIVTMGCGDACPYFPGKRYEDWQLDDPAGQPIEAVRVIRDEIRGRVASSSTNSRFPKPELHFPGGCHRAHHGHPGATGTGLRHLRGRRRP